MLESVIESYLVKRMNKIGGKCIKLNAALYEGIHDRLCVFPNGMVSFCELKAPGKRRRKLQVIWHQNMVAMRQISVKIDSRPRVDAHIKYMLNLC